jgi:hypothetical protein
MARQADRQIRHGFELASRGAMFAARAEFVAGLRLVAQGLDAEERTTVHSRALSDGLTALREAQDFIPTGTKLEADLDLATIIASHRTPVLKNHAPDLRAADALKVYFTYAQGQLAAAAGHEVAGSIALCALGKLHAGLAQQKSQDIPAAEPKAVTLFQAALLACPQNHMAANELGVLLARCGRPDDARRMLEYGAATFRSSVGLENLAAVYQQLGDPRKAASVRQQAEMARREELARARSAQLSANGLVQWVDSNQLASTGGLPADIPLRSSPNQATSQTSPTNQPTPAAGLATSPAGAPQPTATNPSAAQRSGLSWLPWSQEKR